MGIKTCVVDFGLTVEGRESDVEETYRDSEGALT